jgi:hypothetical protein
MGTPSGPLHARRADAAQAYGGRHSRPDPDPLEMSPLSWLLIGIGLLLVAAVIVAIALPGWIKYTVLDERAVQQGVARILTDSGYTVGPVSCPAGQPVEVGHRFSCRASTDGAPRDVVITVRTAGGEYEVSAPR